MKLVGSNDINFKNSKLLYEIKNLKNSILNIEDINYEKKKYRFYKFLSQKNKEARLAEFHLLDENLKILNNSNNTSIKADFKGKFWFKETRNLTDENPLTSSGYYNTEIIVDLKKPTSITKLRFQAPNRDNNIRKGDEYELFYWDKDWVSLGNKKAQNNFLEYDTIPKAALFWLKNYTRGKSEHVFTFSEKGGQIWPSLVDDIDYQELIKSHPYN